MKSIFTVASLVKVNITCINLYQSISYNCIKQRLYETNTFRWSNNHLISFCEFKALKTRLIQKMFSTQGGVSGYFVRNVEIGDLKPIFKKYVPYQSLKSTMPQSKQCIMQYSVQYISRGQSEKHKVSENQSTASFYQ